MKPRTGGEIMSHSGAKISIGVIFACLLAGGQGMAVQADVSPKALWKLDEVKAGAVEDAISGKSDAFQGNYRLIKGVSGSAIKFDGFTTLIRRKAAAAPALSDALTVDAWVALGAYPWNWSGVVTQQNEKQAGYALEIGPLGEFGLKVFAGGECRECISEAKLPLRTWSRLTGTFDKATGMNLYLDGKPAGKLKFSGSLKFASDTDLLIGTNHDKRKAAFIHREYGTLPAWYSLDAALDEVAIYDRALPREKVAQLFAGEKPAAAPDIPPRVLPSGPAGPGRFGAYFTKLQYYWEWDDLFRVAEQPDLVVGFDGSPVRLVFWRGTRFSPTWVTENNLWMADQSVETWDNKEGCFEHMQDPKCLYSHVRVIENTPARIVVHWRYAPVSAYNHLWMVDERTGWGLWIDEYYYIYPDQTAIRKITWQKGTLGRTHQFQESIPLAGPGQVQGDVINPDYVTVANLGGEKQVYSYVPNPPKEGAKPAPANPSIQMHSLKARNKPFIIFEPGGRMHYLRDMDIAALSRPGACNHWPEGQIPCDELARLPDHGSGHACGRNARVGEFALRHDGPGFRRAAAPRQILVESAPAQSYFRPVVGRKLRSLRAGVCLEKPGPVKALQSRVRARGGGRFARPQFLPRGEGLGGRGCLGIGQWENVDQEGRAPPGLSSDPHRNGFQDMDREKFNSARSDRRDAGRTPRIIPCRSRPSAAHSQE